jgi:hypothetical protein
LYIVLLRYGRVKVDGGRQGNYRTLGDIGHSVMEYVITLSCRYTLYIVIAHTNYFISSLSIYIGKTLVSNFSTLSSHLFIDKRPYYNSNLFLNKSIDLTSIGL